jgi:hypothetical protein
MRSKHIFFTYAYKLHQEQLQEVLIRSLKNSAKADITFGIFSLLMTLVRQLHHEPFNPQEVIETIETLDLRS